jgi:hypothetical protein
VEDLAFKIITEIVATCYVNGSIPKIVMNVQSGKLIRQPADFPQRGKSAYSSARSPLRGTMPARLRMAFSSACLTANEAITEIRMLTMSMDYFQISRKYSRIDRKFNHEK